ncbi:MAG: TetR/AcrR family transcriptional regulator [Sphingomonadales bacterium]|jgi:AcrR family transcriptional regulator|nr:TetR/AcrR family transcriptional regulator [Sphingomonadales bacterium]MBK9004216.1 TetR/AcrR family transcriptional regulator [Sphingomonadales bacterium]MBK9269393.1 TetR/AcrR family transcriptional regulator [Sphingomonadales bacterium]
MAQAVERKWRGRMADERKAERRVQLLSAAIQVYSERGFRHSSVKAVCEAAGLTERYFYESFANSEELLVAVASASTNHLIAELQAKANGVARQDRLQTILLNYFVTLRNQPAHARAFMVEIRGISPVVDAYLVSAVETFAELIADATLDSLSRVDRLVAVGAVGAIVHIALDWIINDFSMPIDDVVDAACRLGTVVDGGVD